MCAIIAQPRLKLWSFYADLPYGGSYMNLFIVVLVIGAYLNLAMQVGF